MLLTITTTARPATDLGFLLHKSPERAQRFELPWGAAHVFYPVATEERASCALLLEVDAVGLVGRPGGEAMLRDQYVTDRPYVASSMLSVAIARVFGTALSGRSRERQDLADRTLPLEARLAVVPCRGGERLLRRLFEPLGYRVDAAAHPLDETRPDWGPSRYYTVTLSAEVRLADLLSHLYVLVPVLDDDKHYWVGDDEVDKLLRHGEGWLASHPDRDTIALRYLKHRRSLVASALERLVSDEVVDVEESERLAEREEAQLEARLTLDEHRVHAVVAALKDAGATRVLDLGCGEGKLLRALVRDRRFVEIAGLDVSLRALESARGRLDLDRLPEAERLRVKLLHGSLVYRDARLAGWDAAAVVEVIEHLEPARLVAFERVLFEFARPRAVVLTTPNREYNARFESLASGALRHRDHRFEWTRDELAGWAEAAAARFGYRVRFAAVGPVDERLGAPTQMALFEIAP